MINQPITDQQKEQLSGLLQGEIRFTQNLHQSLELESNALIASDIAALEKATKEKSQHIHQLELLAQERETLVASIGGEKLLEAEPYLSLWQDLLTLAASCQEKNLVNGSIIKIGIRQSQKALDILQGIPDKPELYNHSGQTTRSGKSSTLAQA